MLLLALLAQAAAPAATCEAEVRKDPSRAVAIADNWYLSGGGSAARRCAGLAYAQQGRWVAAAQAFEKAAEELGETKQRAPQAMLWVQAGNARLAAGEALPARANFDRALVQDVLAGQELGELRLDRARANVLAGDQNAARTDLDEALKLVPDDPLAWLLSASLARRMAQLDRAQADIAEAAKRSPDDANVALEAGRIALAGGAIDAARVAFQGAIKNQPGSDAARAAQSELDRLGVSAQR